MIGNVVGLALLGMAAIALCMFISAQTENQIIAAIGGFASILVVLSLNSIASVVSFAPLKQLLTSISFYSRYYDLTIGMINAADLFFFFSFAAVFFFLTTRVLEKRRWSGK